MQLGSDSALISVIYKLVFLVTARQTLDSSLTWHISIQTLPNSISAALHYNTADWWWHAHNESPAQLQRCKWSHIKASQWTFLLHLGRLKIKRFGKNGEDVMSAKQTALSLAFAVGIALLLHRLTQPSKCYIFLCSASKKKKTAAESDFYSTHNCLCFSIVIISRNFPKTCFLIKVVLGQLFRSLCVVCGQNNLNRLIGVETIRNSAGINRWVCLCCVAESETCLSSGCEFVKGTIQATKGTTDCWLCGCLMDFYFIIKATKFDLHWNSFQRKLLWLKSYKTRPRKPKKKCFLVGESK